MIDIGAYEGNNTAPTISCPGPITLNYVPPTGPVATVSVNVADADGDPLVVVWTVDGTAYQTNLVAAGGPPTAASVTFTAAFGAGSHSILVRVIDSTQCEATCSTSIFVAQVEDPPFPPVSGCISVLQLGAAKVSITGPAGGILGDVAISPKGIMSMTGDQYVSGTIMLGSGATFANSSHGTAQVARNVDLSGEINNAYAMAAAAASMPCTQSFAKLDGKTVTTIIGGPGVNVIRVGDITLSGKQLTLLAPAGASFIINVRGKFVLTGGGQGPQIRVAGGLQPQDVLYNIMGTGADVAFSGGGGGVNCCAAVVDGTVLAPLRKIALSPGLVNGAVISAKDISIVSGASVRCPASP